MREIDVDLPAGREGDLPALSIVPPETVVRLGTEKTVSVLALAAGLDPAAELAISTEPKGVVELLDGYSVPLQPHSGGTASRRARFIFGPSSRERHF